MLNEYFPCNLSSVLRARARVKFTGCHGDGMLQRIASLSETEQDEIATALSPLLENDRQPTQHMLEFFTAVRLFIGLVSVCLSVCPDQAASPHLMEDL